jgi:predicted nucleic acid-binding protein
MYTIDTSVWVNGSDTLESGHDISRQLLTVVGQRALPIIAPTLLLPEIAGAISRTRANPLLGERFARQVAALPNLTLIALSDALAHHALALAAQQSLRGADSVYAAVAALHSTTLISLDNEHLTRLVGIVTVLTPAQALAVLTVPP